MASRDNQTLQIIVIVLTLLVIGLGVGLLLINNARKTALARANDATKEASKASTAQRQLQEETNNYKLWMGYGEADTYETLQKSFAEDMQRFGSTFDENSRFYRTILENIHEENRKLALSEVAAKEQVKDLKERLLVTEKQKEEQIAEYRKKMQQVEQDAASERTKFSQQYDEINNEKKEIASQLDEQRRKLDEQAATHQTATKTLDSKIAKLERLNEVLKSDRKEVDPFAQPADGIIRWVNQRYAKVWVNLGKADHLRPQVTFSIYDSDENDALSAERKGSIEISRILSDHMAEARITSDDPKRPLMEGDRIYSQVWNRGRQVGFAITGVIDFDDDGRSDLDQLKSIIEINNGKVDAVPGENGAIDGKMTVDTRYLILGKHPEDARYGSLRKSWDSMSEEADTLGIEPIPLDEFLQLMGWQAGHRTVKLGPGARSPGFPARTGNAALPGSPNNFFRRRTPQPSY